MIRNWNISDDANIALRKIEDGLKLVKVDPPSGYYKVTNLYVNPANGRLVVEYDDEVMA